MKDCSNYFSQENQSKDSHKHHVPLSHWTLFYLFKELIQKFKFEGYNYFRGQSHSWELKPSICRKETLDDTFRKNFETIYSNLYKAFPDKIKYVSLEDINDSSKSAERVEQLALLQHYGFSTNLLDITKNPFVAMLFMLGEKEITSLISPTLYFFKIKENHELLSELPQKHINQRMIAQEGAFLNFDKGIKNKEFTDKILTIKLVIEFSKNENGSTTTQVVLENSRKEMLNKLAEYHYFDEDLFPDFENKLKYLMRKYTKSANDVKKFELNTPKKS